jgi:hypothetical protein
MKSKLLRAPAIAAVVSLVLAGFLTAAALGSRTASLAADANDPTDRNSTRVTAGLLEHSQFSHQRLDWELAAKLQDRYLASLDPARRNSARGDSNRLPLSKWQLNAFTLAQST